MTGTMNPIPISTKLRRIAKLAEEIPGGLSDLDVRSFFDTLDHGKLREILHQRVPRSEPM